MIKHDEGVKTSPYQCPALFWTVGVGHVIDPTHARVK
jgi:GH24 family phage-related lysozyme (muramidase)